MADTFYKELHRTVGSAVLANKVKFMSIKQVSRACSTLQEGEEDLEPAITKADVKAMIQRHSGNTTIAKAQVQAQPVQQVQPKIDYDKLAYKMMKLQESRESKGKS